MFGDFLKRNNITSAAKYVDYGYGQVEPNHLSAQRTGQIYAQLPAAAAITKLEQGQFVKYDYATGEVNFTGAGEWMLVYNETKLYRDHQADCEFAMVKDNYEARVYSPFGGFKGEGKQSRYYNGVDNLGNDEITLKAGVYTLAGDKEAFNADHEYYITTDNVNYTKVENPTVDDYQNYYIQEEPALKFKYDDVTAGPDIYEPFYNEDPFHIEGAYKEALMPEGTKMVPRVFKTNIGDIFTTNTVDEETLAVGDILSPRASDGILVKNPSATSMKWQVVKVYTMPDNQKGVKIMRIA